MSRAPVEDPFQRLPIEVEVFTSLSRNMKGFVLDDLSVVGWQTNSIGYPLHGDVASGKHRLGGIAPGHIYLAYLIVDQDGNMLIYLKHDAHDKIDEVVRAALKQVTLGSMNSHVFIDTAWGTHFTMSAQDTRRKYGVRIDTMSAWNPPEFNEAFWKWFGDSKVVGEDGQPLVVYHGSPHEDIDKFYGGWWATDKRVAKDFGTVYSAYLRIENPVYDNYALTGEPGDLWKLYNEWHESDQTREEHEEESSLIDEAAMDGPFRDYLISKGYDGVIVWDESNRYPDQVFVAFRPEQIKSVNNRGTWNRDDPDITHNPPDAKTLIGISEDGSLEFHLVNGDAYRVKAGWSPDAYGLPMGMRWECSLEQWNRYRNSVFSWVIDAGDLDPGNEE